VNLFDLLTNMPIVMHVDDVIGISMCWRRGQAPRERAAMITACDTKETRSDSWKRETRSSEPSRSDRSPREDGASFLGAFALAASRLSRRRRGQEWGEASTQVQGPPAASVH